MRRATGLAGYFDLDLIMRFSENYALIDVYRRTGHSLVIAKLQVLAIATAMQNDINSIDDSNLIAAKFLARFELIVGVEAVLIKAHREALESLGWN